MRKEIPFLIYKNTPPLAITRAARIFLLLVFALQSISSRAQLADDQQRIDSIFQAIPAMKEDTNTVKYINSIYFEYLWRLNLPEAYNKLKYALRLSKKLGYTEGNILPTGTWQDTASV